MTFRTGQEAVGPQLLGTNRERLVKALRLASLPLDDDQLAEHAGISPRQTVNMLCRRLRADGVVHRVPGPDGKIVNVLVRRADSDRTADQPTEGPVADPSDPTDAPTEQAGHAREQRNAEVHLLSALSTRVGRPLSPTTIRLPSGVRVEVDGADTDRTVLVECWAHIGKVKGAQRLKVLTDAFKLTWIADNIPGRPRLIFAWAMTRRLHRS